MSTTESVAAPPARPPVLATVSDELERLEGWLRDASQVEFPVLRQVLDWVFSSGGKRIRPALVFAVARLGQADRDATTALAAAIETLHAATLVHDDLVDGSLLRRGLPTLNTHWNAGATVLAGDWLFARAAQFAAQAGSVRVMEIFARTLGTLTDGELRQLFGRTGIPTLEEYEYRIYAKTASVFEAAAEATGVLLGAGVQVVDALAGYGRELGQAFQIVDDILDFTGTADHLGKPVGSDLRAGTVTLPALHYLAEHPEAVAWLSDTGDAPDVREQLVEAIRRDEAALDGARQAARAHMARALAATERLPAGEAREELARLARYAVERDM
jgi:geranylgeranyl pyrophosphate synthase